MWHPWRDTETPTANRNQTDRPTGSETEPWQVFKRRKARTWLQAVVQIVYPRGGWRRAASYVVHRLRRLPDPPHKIARGVAAGVFVCFTPYFGFHFFMAVMLAYAMQANLVASLLATFFGNPLTFPIIAAICLEMGQWMLGTPNVGPLSEVFAGFGRASAELWHNVTAIFTAEEAHWNFMADFFWRVMWPYTVGGIIPGIVTAIAAYTLTLPAVRAYQRRRVSKLKARYAARGAPTSGIEGAIRKRRLPKPTARKPETPK